MEKKYALISLTNKDNLELLVKGLVANNYQIIGTTSTAKAIIDLGYPCQSIEEITSFPEMLGGRVKTLQPEIHGGILADLSKEEHLADLKKHGINPISLVVCNLYPFKQALADSKQRGVEPGKVDMNLIENIDIGGITLLRAAAKNYNHVSLLCDPADYDLFIERLEKDEITLAYRQELAMKGFITSANYDSLIASVYMENNDLYPQLLVSAPLKQELRYGENPHQKAFFYESEVLSSYSLNTSTIIQGKELSYNNILDIDAAYKASFEFDDSCVIAFKHNTICGAGFDEDLSKAYQRCFETDSKSIFGGIVIFNREVDANLANKLNEIFLEVIIAPSYTKEALEVFADKPNVRIVQGNFNKTEYQSRDLRAVNGGYLVQYETKDNQLGYDVVTADNNKKHQKELINLYKLCKNVKSNAIVIGQDDLILGIGGGQVSRIDACEMAVKKMLEHSEYDKNKELMLASDGYFPFNDIVDLAKEYNIKYIIQPGGSINDKRMIPACNEAGITLIFTGIRYFRH